MITGMDIPSAGFRKACLHDSNRPIGKSHDNKSGVDIVKIISGDWYVTNDKNEMLTTILGSCISACIRDPIAGVGGMNHFLLPGDASSVPTTDAARYGAYAMESLINAILKMGGRKERLEIKVFGGGNVINSSARIGSKNAQFIRDFLTKEGYHIISSDLEGDQPRRVHYYPSTGKVLLKKLERGDNCKLAAEEENYRRTIAIKPVEGDIDLF